MEQKIILEYAKQHVSSRIEKFENRLSSPQALTPHYKKSFTQKIEKCRIEYAEICKMIDEIED